MHPSQTTKRVGPETQMKESINSTTRAQHNHLEILKEH